MVLQIDMILCALLGKECFNCWALRYRPQPSVTMTHIHNLCTVFLSQTADISLQTQATAAPLYNRHKTTAG